jgi:hypothetical protein
MVTKYRVDFEGAEGWVEGVSFDSMTEANLHGIQHMPTLKIYGWRNFRVVPVSVEK